jgi:hypothetical protein
VIDLAKAGSDDGTSTSGEIGDWMILFRATEKEAGKI